MPIDKFRFVSPGVQVQEIDQSQIPRTPEAMGPVVIGRSVRGPVMRPVKVSSFSDFVDVFGEPVAGGIGGDVWREGNRTAPTYGAYAAQAYLRNSGPLTFIRLAGYEHPDRSSATGKAGWAATTTYGLFIAPISSSSENVYTMPATTASLAAVIYDFGGSSYGLIGKPLSGSTEGSAAVGQWVRATGTNLEFKVVVDGKTKSVNFDENSKKFIRSVLNTNPILKNTEVASSAEKYFLGETFKTWVADNTSLQTIGASSDFAAVLLPLTAPNYGLHEEGAKSAETGWIVSQHKGLYTEFSASADGTYPVQELFKFYGLTEGEWNSQNLKISIEDIKEPPNEFVKFGSFTVSVRRLQDNDVTPQFLERFTNVSLDPSSENYIAKKIGDKFTTWDYEKKLFKENGTYDNKSKFVRVEVNADVDAGLTDPGLVPFGFYGPDIYFASTASVATSASAGYVMSGSAAKTFSTTAISGNAPWTASFALPQLPLLESKSDSPVSAPSSVYWGLKTNYASSKKHNKDLVDYVRPVSTDWSATTSSFLFTLDDVSGTIVSSSISSTSTVSWTPGNRKAGTSLTAYNNGTTVYTPITAASSSLILSVFNKFTIPLLGGSDGVNITEKDPFNRRVLNKNGGNNELTNYAFNSVKVAVESIADAEVVEMNLAAIPGVENKALTGLLIEKCETRGDALAIVDLEGDYVPEEGKPTATSKASDAARKPRVDDVIANLKDRAINSSYGCAYFPWVLIRDNLNNNTVWVPPSVVALGTFSSSQRRTEVWFAPAGFNRGGLTEGSAGLPVLQAALKLTSKDRDALYEANINPIATFPAEGIVIFGQKTLQVTPSALDRINVRRLMIFLKKEISRFATSILFDPNVKVTWSRFTNLAVPFLESVKSRFGLTEYRVVLDETTTTPDLIDRNIVYAKILLKPTRAIEFIAIDFVITNTGASFND